MPLTRNVSQNIRELYKDNQKSGKARGANGKARSRNQIIAIALNAASTSKDFSKHHQHLKKPGSRRFRMSDGGQYGGE